MPPGSVTGPSVWYGRDLAAREHDWIYRLSPAELAELDAAVHIFKASGRPLAAISPEDFPLPAFGGALRRLGAELLEGRGFFMLRGFPVDDYTREEQAIAYMGIGAYFGRSRSQNAKGHLLGHVKDLGLDIADPRVRYYQTNRRLEYHTDSIDVVGLCASRPRAPAARASSPPPARSTTRSSRAGRISCRRCSSRSRPTAAARCRPGQEAVVQHPGVPLARRAADVHLRAPVHRVGAAQLPAGAAPDRGAVRGNGPDGRDRERPGGSSRNGVCAGRHAVPAQPPDPALSERLRELARRSATGTCCASGSRRRGRGRCPRCSRRATAGSRSRPARRHRRGPGTTLKVPLEAE